MALQQAANWPSLLRKLDRENPDVRFQQSHAGMFLSQDSGANWRRVDSGLPSTFGFPAVSHPTRGGTYYIAPLNGAERGRYMPDGAAFESSGKFQVFLPLLGPRPEPGQLFDGKAFPLVYPRP